MNKEIVIYHLLPHKKGWCLHKEGSVKLSRIISTRRQGERIGNLFIKKYKRARLLIHDKGGVITDFIDYVR